MVHYSAELTADRWVAHLVDYSVLSSAVLLEVLSVRRKAGNSDCHLVRHLVELKADH